MDEARLPAKLLENRAALGTMARPTICAGIYSARNPCGMEQDCPPHDSRRDSTSRENRAASGTIAPTIRAGIPLRAKTMRHLAILPAGPAFLRVGPAESRLQPGSAALSA